MPVTFKIAGIGFNYSSCVSLDLILRSNSSALMPARPVEAVAQEPVHEQKLLSCPDCKWLSKHTQQNTSGLITVASPFRLQNFDGLTGTVVQAKFRG